MKVQLFRNRYQKHLVIAWPSKTWGQVCLLLERDGIWITNSYGGDMNGRLRIGMFWSGLWKHGLRWLWQVRKPL